MKPEFYYANRGRGKQVARIVKVKDDTVYMEWKASETAITWHPFQLPVSYLNSDKCGWRKRKPAQDAVRA